MSIKPRSNTTASSMLLVWPIALYACLTIFSHQSQLYIPPIPGITKDKLIHFLVFGLLATSILRVFYRNKPTFILYINSILLTSCLGGLDEIHQGFIVGRSLEFLDWFADTLGGFCAVFAYAYIRPYRKLLEIPFKR